MAYQELGSLMSTAQAAAAVARDPFLPEVTRLVLELQSEEKKAAATSPSSGSTGVGIGLRNVVGPLRFFVKTQKHPWLLPVAAAGIVGGLFALGYITGKKAR